jgi:uncharacterized protein YndB with AHSA1/START domain
MKPLTQAPSLRYVRRIRATPAKVWNAFVDPLEIMHWWGPDEGPTLSAQTDLRVGGRFRVAFCTVRGERFENVGEYLEVDPPRRLVMSWWFSATPHLRSVVTVSINAVDGGAEVTIQHDGFSDDGLPVSHAAGWAGALTKLAQRVEIQDPATTEVI